MGRLDQASRTDVGAIWFPRRRAAEPATIGDGGGTWTEFWDNNGPVLRPVPLWRLRLDPPRADDGARPEGVTLAYSRMPNSNIEWDAARRQVVCVIGGATRRSSGAGWVSFV